MGFLYDSCNIPLLSSPNNVLTSFSKLHIFHSFFFHFRKRMRQLESVTSKQSQDLTAATILIFIVVIFISGHFLKLVINIMDFIVAIRKKGEQSCHEQKSCLCLATKSLLLKYTCEWLIEGFMVVHVLQ